MRTIKFRAWVTTENCFIQHKEVIERVHLQFCDNLGGHKDIVELFTGLHDKNGKEVFEGDIVRHEKWDVIQGKYVYSDHEVYFDDELLEFGLRESNELFHCQFLDEFEVVGNIHENPNLLKP